MFRTYMTDSGLVPISATGVSAPLLYLTAPATADGNIFKIKISCEAGAGPPTVPTSSSLAVTLNTHTGTKAGRAPVRPSPAPPGTPGPHTVASSRAGARNHPLPTPQR